MTASSHASAAVRKVPISLVGDHPLIVQLRMEIEEAAPLSLSVVVQGPTGAGKELVASLLHERSGREGPLVVVNVATLDNPLADAELFGAERGAYTSANHARDGLVAAAADGTLYLDEAGDLARPVQAKLLRAIEDGGVRRLGATRQRQVRFRLVISTQSEPEELVRSQRWRDDFMFRVTGLVLRVPPLRDRISDVPKLVDHFLVAIGRPAWPAQLIDFLMQQSWPGNVRQLRHVVQRATVFAGSGPVVQVHLDRSLAHGRTLESGMATTSLATWRRDTERKRIEEAIRTAGTYARAADALEISERTLYRRIRALGIARNDWRT